MKSALNEVAGQLHGIGAGIGNSFLTPFYNRSYCDMVATSASKTSHFP